MEDQPLEKTFSGVVRICHKIISTRVNVLLRLLHLLALKCGKMVHGNHIIQHLQQTGNIG